MLKLCSWTQIEKLTEILGLDGINEVMENPHLRFASKIDFYVYLNSIRGADSMSGLFIFDVGGDCFKLSYESAPFFGEENWKYYDIWTKAEHNVWHEIANWSSHAWSVGSITYLDVSAVTPKTHAEAGKHYLLLSELSEQARPASVSHGIQHCYEIKALPDYQHESPALLLVEECYSEVQAPYIRYLYIEPGVLTKEELALVEQWRFTEKKLIGEFVIYGDSPEAENKNGPKNDEEKEKHRAVFGKLMRQDMFRPRRPELPRVPTVVVCFPNHQE